MAKRDLNRKYGQSGPSYSYLTPAEKKTNAKLKAKGDFVGLAKARKAQRASINKAMVRDTSPRLDWRDAAPAGPKTTAAR